MTGGLMDSRGPGRHPGAEEHFARVPRWTAPPPPRPWGDHRDWSPADTPTAFLPPIRDDDATAVLPAIPSPTEDATVVLPALRETPIPVDSDASDDAEAAGAARPHAAPAPGPRRGGHRARLYRSTRTRRRRATLGARLLAGVQVTGELLMTFGLVVLLFAAYEVWGKSAAVNAHQQDLVAQLAEKWEAAPTVVSPSSSAAATTPPASGTPIARLYIPKLGKSWVVVEGVAQKDIRYAPGHYPNTAMPGEIGNFAVAGHRNPATFWRLDEVGQGDVIVVEDKRHWHVYRVTQNHIVEPSRVEVVAPVPNQPGVKPTRAMLTLTTCHPKYDNYQRLIVHAELVRSQPKSDGRPAELGG